ncbi:MAG TPA: amidohydrolase family protein [Pyrinomonadaceae bacterium]|nr:amidohydrolase family protein [Pyrinomonadaceae bacterium]
MARSKVSRFAPAVALCVALLTPAARPNAHTPPGAARPGEYLFDDVHFHLTNYVQEGIGVHDFLTIMGDKAGRSTLFGIPLQQQWSYRIDGDRGPTYYLNSDAPLYYYSFTDAWIAAGYRSLSKEEQARLDPMITGFNPADMYAADHVRRVLTAFPGVFSGIGEFSIHKEFVSAKVAGGVASLNDPALDRLIDFAAEVGLVVLIHNDIDTPFAREGSPPAYFDEVKALFRRHPAATFVWAHIGVGRIVRPARAQGALVEELLKDPAFGHVNFDISWSEVAKYAVATPESARAVADVINRYPDRFLFGTDEVAPKDQETYLRVYNQYAPLWKLLDPAASEKVRKGNYERIFDAARLKVRAWERTHVKAM